MKFYQDVLCITSFRFLQMLISWKTWPPYGSSANLEHLLSLFKGFQWNFTGMFAWLSLRFLQLKLIHWKMWLPLDKACWPYIAIICSGMFFGWLTIRFRFISSYWSIEKPGCQLDGHFCPIWLTSKLFFSESVQRISIKFYRDVLWMTLYKIPSACVDQLKNMAASGWGIFVWYMALVQTSKNDLRIWYRF